MYNATTHPFQRRFMPKMEDLTVGIELEVLLPATHGLRRPIERAYEVAPHGVCRHVASVLRRLTGDGYRAPRTFSYRRPGFYVKPEEGLDDHNFPEECIVGLEFVTPPFKLKEARRVFQRLKNALREMEAQSYVNAGIHINLSGNTSLDGRGIALSLDEETLLNNEGRAGSPGLAIQEEAYFPRAIRRKAVDPDFNLEANWLSRNLGKGKRFATNLGKTYSPEGTGYLELRHWSAGTSMAPETHLDKLIQPYYDALYISDTQECARTRCSQINAATSWLKAMADRIHLETLDDYRRNSSARTPNTDIFTKQIRIDDARVGEFREGHNGSYLTLNNGLRNPSARKRQEVDLAEVRETLAHMVLQEARYLIRNDLDGKCPGFVEEMLTWMGECDALPI